MRGAVLARNAVCPRRSATKPRGTIRKSRYCTPLRGWRVAAAAGLVVCAAGAGWAATPAASKGSLPNADPFAITPIQASPITPPATPRAIDPFAPPGYVVDVHGREIGWAAEQRSFHGARPMGAVPAAHLPADGAQARSSEAPGNDGAHLEAAPAVAVVPQIPEPSSVALLGVGLGVVVWAVRRRARR
jgi:hypothetical protein